MLSEATKLFNLKNLQIDQYPFPLPGLSKRVEGLSLCTCAEPCPDDRSGSIQYQDKEANKKSEIYGENTCKSSVHYISAYNCNED
jgi:hypothetical protein